MSRRADFEKLKTNYHIWSDERFFDIQKERPEDMELLEVMRKVNTFDNKPIVFYKVAALNMIKKFHLDNDLNIFYFSDFPRNYSTPEYELNFDNIMPVFPTVVHYLILLAVYMGFSEIYLLGCDCTGILNTIQSAMSSNTEMFYSYKITENERKRMKRSNTTFPIQDELRSYAKIFDDYELLDKYCKLRDVKLYNATEGSLLNSIVKAKLNNILNL